MSKASQKTLKEEVIIISEKVEPSSIFQQFKEQMFRAWLPIPTLNKTITLFFAMSAIFIGIGIPMIIMSNQIIEVQISYDKICQASNCTVSFTIPQTMQAPIFVYYQLQRYYQNHRMYASSVSQRQLAGQVQSISDISTICHPIVLNKDLYVNYSIDGTKLVPTEPANPCGMIAFSYFNDTFNFLYPNGTNISLTTDGIAWPSDVKRYKLSNKSLQWLDVTNPQVMNWMRIASLPSFRKVWARINNNLPSGNYSVQIVNNYNVNQFGSTKSLVISTSNIFGSKNTFLSIMYLVMGSICFLIGLIFLFRKLKNNRQQKKKRKA